MKLQVIMRVIKARVIRLGTFGGKTPDARIRLLAEAESMPDGLINSVLGRQYKGNQKGSTEHASRPRSDDPS